MPMFLYGCGKCGRKKKHFFAEGSEKTVACVCGEKEQYTRRIGTFQSTVNYNTIEEIMENEIDPHVNSFWEKAGKELVNGDVTSLENFYGEQKLKDTFYESDTWVDEDGID